MFGHEFHIALKIVFVLMTAHRPTLALAGCTEVCLKNILLPVYSLGPGFLIHFPCTSQIVFFFQ